MPGVTIKGLTKRYGSMCRRRRTDLRGHRRASWSALLGPSGCGKTTTLRLIAGFLEPDAGEIWVGGRCSRRRRRSMPPERRGMSMIFQSYALWPHMTVVENVAYGLRLRGLPEGRAEAPRRDRS